MITHMSTYLSCHIYNVHYHTLSIHLLLNTI